MAYYICETCGVQYECTLEEPRECIICKEERQFINPNGQKWTTLERLVKSKKYHNHIRAEEENLYSIVTEPNLGIGQTAYLIQNDDFNLLWDCITYLDSQTIEKVNALGGIDAIALSHPHYYSSQVEWAETFNAPLYIHEDDRTWVTRASKQIVFWTGDSIEVKNGLILHRIGGHFKGGAILEWEEGNKQHGVIFSGDIIRVAADQHWVTFMYSYPNFIPLPIQTVERISIRLNNVQYTRLYDAFNRIIMENAKQKVNASANRYIAALKGELFET